MASSPFEQTFLSSVTKEGLQRLKHVLVSDFQDLCSALDKEEILMLVQAKLPDAIRLAEIIRAIP